MAPERESELAQCKASRERLREENVRLETTVDITNKEREKIESTLERLREENFISKTTVNVMEKEREKMERTQEKERAAWKESVAALQDFREENIRLKTKVNVTNKEREKMERTGEKERAALEQSVAEMQRQLDANNQKIGSLEQSVAEMQGQLDAKNQKIGSLEQSVAEMQRQLDAKNQKIGSQLAENESSRKKILELQTSLQEYRDANDRPGASSEARSRKLTLRRSTSLATKTNGTDGDELWSEDDTEDTSEFEYDSEHGLEHQSEDDSEDDSPLKCRHPSLSPIVADIKSKRRLRPYQCPPVVLDHLERIMNDWNRRDDTNNAVAKTAGRREHHWIYAETECFWQSVRRKGTSTWRSGRGFNEYKKIACEQCRRNRRLCCVRVRHQVHILPHARDSIYERDELEFWTGYNPAPLDEVYKNIDRGTDPETLYGVSDATDQGNEPATDQGNEPAAKKRKLGPHEATENEPIAVDTDEHETDSMRPLKAQLKGHPRNRNSCLQPVDCPPSVAKHLETVNEYMKEWIKFIDNKYTGEVFPDFTEPYLTGKRIRWFEDPGVCFWSNVSRRHQLNRKTACVDCQEMRRLCCVKDGNDVLILPHRTDSIYTRDQLEFWAGYNPAGFEEVFDTKWHWGDDPAEPSKPKVHFKKNAIRRPWVERKFPDVDHEMGWWRDFNT